MKTYKILMSAVILLFSTAVCRCAEDGYFGSAMYPNISQNGGSTSIGVYITSDSVYWTGGFVKIELTGSAVLNTDYEIWGYSSSSATTMTKLSVSYGNQVNAYSEKVGSKCYIEVRAKSGAGKNVILTIKSPLKVPNTGLSHSQTVNIVN